MSFNEGFIHRETRQQLEKVLSTELRLRQLLVEDPEGAFPFFGEILKSLLPPPRNRSACSEYTDVNVIIH